MNKIKLGYDDNLGMPADFTITIGCDIVPFHDLSQMLHEFDSRKLTAIFLPSGALPYVSNYQIISQALFGSMAITRLCSNFVTTKNITIHNIQNFSIGRVNQYCTTSFWAPLISFMNFMPKHTPLNFVNTNGFQDMLNKTATAQIDCSMVWDIIMQQNLSASSKVHELFHKDDLPTPIIIAHGKLDSSIQEKINSFITKDKKSFFTGFKPADIQAINKFIMDMKKASEHFNIVTEMEAS